MSTPHPTFRSVATRPKWIGVLVLCILVAAVFALLGQWQIERAVQQGQGDDRDTETAVPLVTVAEPASTLTSEAGGRMVSFTGTWVAEDFDLLEGRKQDEERGTWVIGRVLVDRADGQPVSLPVALSWFADHAAAEALVAELSTSPEDEVDLVGRLMPTEAPSQGDVRGGTSEAMSVAALINEWDDYDGLVYGSYAILDEASAAASGALVDGAQPVVSMRPVTDTQLNWLNVFYAIEWVAFMLFAFYLWYRLVRDAHERELEALEDAEAAAAAADAGQASDDEPRR